MWMHLGVVECSIPFSGHYELDLDSDLGFRIIVSGAFLLYYLSQDSHILCVNELSMKMFYRL